MAGEGTALDVGDGVLDVGGRVGALDAGVPYEGGCAGCRIQRGVALDV